MTLNVLSFCVKGTLKAHYILQRTLENAVFYILVKDNGKVKELTINVPKRFKFYSTSFPVGLFTFRKLKEYEILVSFLQSAKDLAKEKWKLSESRYWEVLTGLALYMVRRHYKGSVVSRALRYAHIWANLQVVRGLGKLFHTD